MVGRPYGHRWRKPIVASLGYGTRPAQRRVCPQPVVFEYRQPKHASHVCAVLAKVAGSRQWDWKGYAPGAPRRPWTLQEALFSYAEVLYRFSI